MSATTAVPVQKLAERLAQARSQRRTIPQLVHEHPELDLETAYVIQAAGFAQRIAQGERLIGYKIGLSSRTKQQSAGVQEPVYAPLSNAMVHPEESPLRLSTLVHPLVEAEIAFVLGEDLHGSSPTVASVLRATAGLLPAFDILDSRFDDSQFSQPDAVADNASAARIVVGGRLVPPDHLDPQLEGVVVRVDGHVTHTGAGAEVSGHPALAVAWLARAVGGLKAGHIVLTGGLTDAVALTGPRSVSAEFTHLGRIVLTLD